ncbi:hypothetical protein FA13DRAFT_1783227 [Coprinellus micaceus]|uniref:Uncharacterized protein n=1 Tax=Coprinellus micaceus TaxID=71717 RepID=A0A4Y7RME4_COPMI|nr:hypothetical protein FA13DRAFT_1783227 [Coprinellus micaceus]
MDNKDSAQSIRASGWPPEPITFNPATLYQLTCNRTVSGMNDTSWGSAYGKGDSFTFMKTLGSYEELLNMRRAVTSTWQDLVTPKRREDSQLVAQRTLYTTTLPGPQPTGNKGYCLIWTPRRQSEHNEAMQTPRENPFALLSLAYVALTGDPFRQPFLEGVGGVRPATVLGYSVWAWRYLPTTISRALIERSKVEAAIVGLQKFSACKLIERWNDDGGWRVRAAGYGRLFRNRKKCSEKEAPGGGPYMQI